MKKLEISQDEILDSDPDDIYVWIRTKLIEAGFDMDKPIFGSLDVKRDGRVYIQED